MTQVSCKPEAVQGGRDGNGEGETATVHLFKSFFSTVVVPGTSTETHVLVAGVGVGTDHEIVPSLPNLPIQITVETTGEVPHVV